jgi:hypothetical protein
MTSTIRERRQQVAEFLTEQGRAALRVVAEATGLSRSSVHQSNAVDSQSPNDSAPLKQIGLFRHRHGKKVLGEGTGRGKEVIERREVFDIQGIG